jgi:hypothetical protein
LEVDRRPPDWRSIDDFLGARTRPKFRADALKQVRPAGLKGESGGTNEEREERPVAGQNNVYFGGWAN